MHSMFSSYNTSSAFRCGLLSLALVLGLALPASAQSGGDGSVYSRFGLGQLRDFSSSRIEAMGGGGYAMRSLNYVNFGNPAAWSDQVLTRAAAGVLYQEVDATEASGESSRLTAGSLNSIQFSFPLLTRELGFGLAFRPYSRSIYRVRATGQLQVAPDSLISFEKNKEGRGGLQQLTGGLGYRLSDALSVGASVHVIFGIIENAQRTVFPEAPGYIQSDVTSGTRLWGVTGTLGGLLTLSDVFGEEDVLSVGAAFTLPASLSARRTRTFGRGLSRDTLSVERGSVEIPLEATLGLAYQPDARWTVTADALYEPWSRFESTLAFPSFVPSQQDLLNDRVRTALGVEFLPAGEDLLEPYLERVAYRLGGYFERGYTRVPEAGSQASGRSTLHINTLAVTGGLSFPTLLAGTRLDVNFEVGRRGTTRRGLVRDMFYGIALNVNIGERWFQERRLR